MRLSLPQGINSKIAQQMMRTAGLSRSKCIEWGQKHLGIQRNCVMRKDSIVLKMYFVFTAKSTRLTRTNLYIHPAIGRLGGRPNCSTKLKVTAALLWSVKCFESWYNSETVMFWLISLAHHSLREQNTFMLSKRSQMFWYLYKLDTHLPFCI